MSIRILVIDDEPQIHRVLLPALAAWGYEVLEAQTGRDALRTIATTSPEVILLDLGLPRIDGTEVLRHARYFSKPRSGAAASCSDGTRHWLSFREP